MNYGNYQVFVDTNQREKDRLIEQVTRESAARRARDTGALRPARRLLSWLGDFRLNTSAN